MLAFSPDERYRCCQHNVVQGWPYFVEHLWSATRDRGLATCLYAPCQVAARAGDGADVRIAVDTRYPFEGDVVVAVRSTPPSRFPLYFRVPRWCDGVADISIDGRASKAGAKGGDFVKVERQWDFSVVRLRFPQAIEVKLLGPDRDRVSVSRGPLTYSLAIEEEWSWSDIGDLWSSAEVHAGSPWNYALELGTDPQVLRFEPTELDLVSAALGGRSFEHAVFAPFSWVVEPRIIARARRVPAWQVDSTGLVAPMQPGPVVTDEPVEEVRLLPMGCARLRISAFPAVAAAGEGHVWKTPAKAPRASHVHDDPLALTDGVLPKRSNDHDVPRFTFWDHVGTVEWVQQEFDVPRLVSHCGVYWFDDTGTGRCRVPKSWRVLWLDDSGDWREVAKPSSYGVAKDSMNEVTFEPVATKSLRLEVTLQPDFSAGMFEWSVGE
jgi:hypothetical protein